MDIAGRNDGLGLAGGFFYACTGRDPGQFVLLMFQPAGSFPSEIKERACALVRHAFFSEELGPRSSSVWSWMRQLNNRVCHDFEQVGVFFALFVAIVDSKRSELTYVNAGHQAPFVQRAAGGSVERLGPNAPALGLIEIGEGESATLPWMVRDLLLCVNDDVVEVEDDRRVPFGEDRVAELLATQEPSATAREVIEALFLALRDFGSSFATQPAALAVRFSD